MKNRLNGSISMLVLLKEMSFHRNDLTEEKIQEYKKHVILYINSMKYGKEKWNSISLMLNNNN